MQTTQRQGVQRSGVPSAYAPLPVLTFCARYMPLSDGGATARVQYGHAQIVALALHTQQKGMRAEGTAIELMFRHLFLSLPNDVRPAAIMIDKSNVSRNAVTVAVEADRQRRLAAGDDKQYCRIRLCRWVPRAARSWSFHDRISD